MKKFMIGILLLCVSSTPAMAKVYVDLNGAYLNADDAIEQTGYGGGLAVSLGRDFNLLYRGLHTSATKNANDWNEMNYEHMMQMVGVEYGMPLFSSRFTWKTSFLAGYSDTRLEKEEMAIIDEYNDSGISVALWTGIKFDATQRISPFIDVGYHYAYYTGGLKDDNISGVMIMAGVRICVWGPSKRIDDGY